MTWLRDRVARDNDEAGFTLIELIVVMSIFSMILVIITGTIVGMLTQTRRETGTSDNLDGQRRVIETLDRSVRFASDINTPGTGSDGGLYVEYEVGNSGQQQTCYQYRWEPSTQVIQSRTWQPPLNGGGSVTATSWATVASGITQYNGLPVFSMGAVTGAVHEELDIQFTITHQEGPARSSQASVALTAINSAEAVPVSPAVCNEVGRP
jgi:prepilin-type N-terminal cleavage/methylation domain-containing protein